MKKRWHWLVDNWLFLAVCFLLAFIPLYPKLPLLDIVHTWVYVRLEDLLVAAIATVYLLEKIKNRQLPETPLTKQVLVYWGMGLFSLLVAIFYTSSRLPEFFPHLGFLHFFRRVEYMLLFFLAYEAVARSQRRLPWIVAILVASVFLIIVYGVGQKFSGWPAYLTMNEEFAKGVPLRLPPTARIASTFGGHYDLAAYLVLTIPILGSLVFGIRRWFLKILVLTVAVGGFILLLFTASRISFGVYLVAVTLMLLWQKRYFWIIPVIVLSFVLLNFVSGAADRFYKTFRFDNVIIDLSSGKPIGTLDKLEGGSAVVATQESPAVENLPKGSGFISVPPPVAQPTVKPIQTIEVLTRKNLATGSGEVATISGSFLIQKALVYDISITTRFQGQWPKAMAAFRRNFLLGSGFSSLSLAADGDYHRMLGETGVLGTIAFLVIFLTAFVIFFRVKDRLEPLPRAFMIGVFAGLSGLLFNALLIDVFEASKVAFTLWLLTGVALALSHDNSRSWPGYGGLIWRTISHPIAVLAYLLVAVFWIWRGVLSGYFLGDDFTWLRWATESTTSDLVRYFTDSAGFFYRPISKLVYFGLFSIFWLKPIAYHILSLALYAVMIAALYVWMRGRGVRIWLAWLVALVYAGLSIHHENVFWISGLSSLLGGASFLTALVLYQSDWIKQKKLALLPKICSLFLLFVSLLSYEGMISVPLIVVLIAWSMYKRQKWSTLIPILLIPAYLWLRNSASALLPGGDYNYRVSTFLVNFLANTLGYVAGSFVGPQAMEVFAAWRVAWKMRLNLLLPVSVVFLLIAAGWTWAARKLIREYRPSVVMLLCFGLSLVPYFGLGGMADRYALIPSAFLCLSLAELVEIWLAKKPGIIRAGLVIVLLLGIWRVNELARTKHENEWMKASEVSEQALLTLKENYYPLKAPTTFIFVNVPIRYGRAWIFPTGLPDAIWQMFRGSPHETLIQPSLEAAWQYPVGTNTREVLIFNGQKLEKVEREIKFVESSVHDKK